MSTRLFSLFCGLFYVLLGLCGFVDVLVRSPAYMVPVRNTDSAWDVGLLFYCLPVTTATNLLHLAVGAAGVFAFVSYAASLKYVQGLTVFMAGLVVLGCMPFGLNTLWGVMPLSGGTLALHLITAPMAFYFAFVEPFRRVDEPVVA